MKLFRLSFIAALLVLCGQTFTVNAQTLTFLHPFLGSPDGSRPVTRLVQGSDGNFYGTTEFGGANGSGTVFRISSSGSYTVLHSFDSAPDGNIPLGGLVQGSDGNFYGTTSAGGTGELCPGGCGTIYRINSSGSYATLHSFTAYPVDGSSPFGELVEGVDSNFYGTTYGGGTNFLGTVFQFNPSGVVTTLYMFGDTAHDGSTPEAGLVWGSNSNFYGTTYSGGTSENGTVFRISSSGTYTSLYSFAGSPDGFNPAASLVEGADGNFYGTTLFGGTGGPGLGDGTIFRISPSGTYTSLYSFAGYPGGALPQAGLILATDGNFYGTTTSGGSPGLGTAFRMTTNGLVTTLCTFVGTATNGSAPYGSLVQATDGNFYGTTAGGGPENDGTVFKLVVAGVSGGGGGTNCTYSINPTNAMPDAAGDAGTINVTAPNGCAWTAVSNEPFITITSSNSGSGNGTVHYTVAANTNTTSRIGTITVENQTLTITQSGASAETCVFSLSTTNITLAAKGGSKNVSVKTVGTACAWTAVSNDPFITITAGASGTGNGKVDFTVLGNTNTTSLIGTITIAGHLFTVDQLAGGCTYKLSPKAGKIKATGGTAIVKVTPNLTDCDWTAVSNDPFITITTGASGAGKGSVSYTVMPNESSQTVTGTMTIAGQSYAVIQAGAK